MPEKQNQQSIPPENTDKPAREKENPVREAGPSSRDGKDELPDRIASSPKSKGKSGSQTVWTAVDRFLESLDEEEEPPPPPGKPPKESIQDFIERWRDPEKRKEMLKEFGKWSRTVLLRCAVFFLLFLLTIWGTTWALNFSETRRVKFNPPADVREYLISEHENLEAVAYQITPSAGKKDDIPFDRFDTKLIETVKPIKIYADEYGVYLMTSKGWYNGEHGIFIAKDGKNMPEINWGLIKGRIYTYAIYE